MGEQLGPLDAAFLELEEGDESAHMHIGWAMVFDPLPGGGKPSLGQIRELLEERLDLLPRFRHRLSSPRVAPFSWPSWEPDTEFEIANHVRHARLPRPGGEAELYEWLGDFYSHRLDRARPLWEITLLEGLERGRWALATKVHHSLVDGISGASVTTVILDAEPQPPPGSKGLLEGLQAEAREEPGGRGPFSLITDSMRAGVNLARHPREAASSAFSRSRELVDLLIRDELMSAPHTSLNVSIGSTRRFAATQMPLDDLKQVKNELGGTVNDVVLAACAGGLRRLFEHRGEQLDVDSVRVMVPVSVRRAAEQLTLGNRVSSLFVELPISEPDTVRRYRKTAAAAETLKRGGQSRGGETAVELAGAAPPLIHSVVARLAFTPRLFNITITNVPGPQMPLYALGAPLLRVIPLVPIFAGHALGIAAVSYNGQIAFGLNADRTKVPDIDLVREGIEESLEELRSVAGARRPARGSEAA